MHPALARVLPVLPPARVRIVWVPHSIRLLLLCLSCVRGAVHRIALRAANAVAARPRVITSAGTCCLCWVQTFPGCETRRSVVCARHAVQCRLRCCQHCSGRCGAAHAATFCICKASASSAQRKLEARWRHDDLRVQTGLCPTCAALHLQDLTTSSSPDRMARDAFPKFLQDYQCIVALTSARSSGAETARSSNLHTGIYSNLQNEMPMASGSSKRH